MFRSVLNNMFAKNKSLQISASRFNHCSTVCQHKGGVLIAWYSGSGECKDDQSVHVIFINGSKKSEVLRIGDCTGNPVLWSNGDEAVLLWSKFEDTGDMKRLVDRWKHCSLWIQRLTLKDEIELLGTPERLVTSDEHLLGRCSPIESKNGYLLLPLYDEVTGECVIFGGAGTFLHEQSRFGDEMIQPTLWENTEDGKTKICSLSRNFGGQMQYSRFCESSDNGFSWTVPIPSTLFNINNSVHVVKWGNENMVLWNDTGGRYRRNMTLGVLESPIQHDPNGLKEVRATPLAVVGPAHGSYPSMCVDSGGNLNFTFTNADRTIDHTIWSPKEFRNRRRDSSGSRLVGGVAIVQRAKQ
jgi:hypothetical protein